MSQPGEPAAGVSPCFEEALRELESIVHELEEGQVALAEALDRYERGVRLLKHCYGLLDSAQRRIELLTGMDGNGDPVTEPLDDPGGASLEEKVRLRSQRRSRTPKTPSGGGSDEVDDRGGLF